VFAAGNPCSRPAQTRPARPPSRRYAGMPGAADLAGEAGVLASEASVLTERSEVS
jgi:hypothetical protein